MAWRISSLSRRRLPSTTTPKVRTLPDPAATKGDQKTVEWNRVPNGRLFVDGATPDDVVQGYLGNCYMVAAFAAVANSRPEVLKNAIKDNGDGTYTVRLYEKGVWGKTKEVFVTVDGDVPTTHWVGWKTSGTGHYGKSRDSSELWVSLLEKAFAKRQGGYEALNNGGVSLDVMKALTGKSGTFTWNKDQTADQLYAAVVKGAGHPMTAGTYPPSFDYAGTGIIAGHAYTVLGAEERGGQKYLRLRNPFGHSEPTGDGQNDGIFLMKAQDFQRLFKSLQVGD